jgi:hypothetical protein
MTKIFLFPVMWQLEKMMLDTPVNPCYSWSHDFLDNGSISDLYVNRRTQPIITKFGIKTHIISKCRDKNESKRYKCFHPPLACSKHTISSFLLNGESKFLLCSSRYSYAQKRSQYVPLKITCRIELCLILWKIISLRVFNIAQHNAAIPTQIKAPILLFWL